MIPFVRDFDPAWGRLVRVTPRIGRVTARNPGPFTFTGTGTYLIGDAAAGASLAVIDPGPADNDHLAALLAAVAGRRVSHVLVTHSHRDHAALAQAFARAVSAPVSAARPPARTVHASGVEEGDDETFVPDRILEDGEVITGDGWTLETLATPGHASDHLSFALHEENALFCGDHVMGWSTTVVAPPDGDMAAYMASLDKVIARRFDRLFPTHGAPIEDPAPFLGAYRDHRLARDAQILARLAAGDRRISEIVPHLYATVDARLWPAASLSVWAHLIALVEAGRAQAGDGATLDGVYSPVG
ncbi:MBL fold metallo-hydrolase [Brevundimonas sp.]|uniref:MBL fold metallo-hydrolase n=1 Tax=Brevundimonas sp. TaxID=1871086 RepID=UPI00262DBD1E|nr:MBL fold metallo-hydrolase [Brevundimonas sp.]